MVGLEKNQRRINQRAACGRSKSIVDGVASMPSNYSSHSWHLITQNYWYCHASTKNYPSPLSEIQLTCFTRFLLFCSCIHVRARTMGWSPKCLPGNMIIVKGEMTLERVAVNWHIQALKTRWSAICLARPKTKRVNQWTRIKRLPEL
jgi:hypothetical protein